MKLIRVSLIATALALLAENSTAAEFQVDKTAGNRVRFTSQTTLDNFAGETNRIDGYILFAGSDSLAASEIHLEVELDQLDTGISLRNRHMRENALETDKFPLAVYHGKATAVRQDAPDHYLVTATGTLTLHGEEKEMTVTATVQVSGRKARIEAEFSVRLAEYSIRVPKVMFLKVNEIIPVKVDFTIVQVNP